jgi:carbamoyl-phosphate synthase large subunit
MGLSVDEVFDLTKIDKWFLVQIEQIVKIELDLDKLAAEKGEAAWSRWTPPRCARSSRRASPTAVWPSCSRPRNRPCASAARSGRAPGLQARGHLRRRVRHQHGLPVLDLRATAASRVRGRAHHAKKIMVLGGGPNRIGQGIEFDYCCVHAALAMREDGYETIMVNCNPETVSTDYDTSDRLYFEPVTLEDVLEIVDKEKPGGVIVQYGGQTPLKLALDLEAAGVPIIGTTPDMIDRRRPRALPEAAARAGPAPAAQPPRRAPSPRPWKRPLHWATRWWCAPATCWVAARWKSCTSTRPGALHARGREGEPRLARAARPLPLQRHRVRRGLRARRPA